MSSPKSQAEQPSSRPAAERLAERTIELGRDSFAGSYVALARGARRVARASGALDALDRRRDRLVPLFFRSLFAVHDLDELDRLDLPWWTFGAVTCVDAFLRGRGGTARAFEWGAGASTLWLSRRCARVVSVEHDPTWWPPLAERLRTIGHVEASLVPPVPSGAPVCPSFRAGWTGLDFAPYVRAIREAGGPFDLIVIDGRARSACLDEAVRHLAPHGLIVFDNTDRRRYRDALDRCGLAVRRMRGFAPAVPWPSQTALLANHPAARVDH